MHLNYFPGAKSVAEPYPSCVSPPHPGFDAGREGATTVAAFRARTASPPTGARAAGHAAAFPAAWPFLLSEWVGRCRRRRRGSAQCRTVCEGALLEQFTPGRPGSSGASGGDGLWQPPYICKNSNGAARMHSASCPSNRPGQNRRRGSRPSRQLSACTNPHGNAAHPRALPPRHPRTHAPRLTRPMLPSRVFVCTSRIKSITRPSAESRVTA